MTDGNGKNAAGPSPSSTVRCRNATMEALPCWRR